MADPLILELLKRRLLDMPRRKANPSIGFRIKKVREDVRMTQRTLAKIVNITIPQLSRYEAGRSTPSISILADIAHALEVPIELLAIGDDRKYASLAKIRDEQLLTLFRRADKLKKPERDQIKWAIEGLLSNISSNGDRGITTASDSSAIRKIAKSSS